MSDIQNAFRLIGSLDLTSLSHDDTEEKIAALCAKAVTPYGTTAAVCVYPEWVPLARKLLKKTPVKVATVVNFPAGGNDFKLMKDHRVSSQTKASDHPGMLYQHHTYAPSLQRANAANTHTVSDYWLLPSQRYCKQWRWPAPP